MKFTNVFLLAMTLMLQRGRAADETNLLTDTKIVSNAEQMKALRNEVDDAEAAYMKAVDQDENSDRTEKLWNQYSQINQTNLPKIFELARQEPASETSFEAFEWIVMNRRIQMSVLYTNGLQSLEFLNNYHATNPRIAPRMCRLLGIRWQPTCQPAIGFLQTVANKNPAREVRGQATLALARFVKDNFEYLEFWKSAPLGNAQFEKDRTDFMEQMKNKKTETLSHEAEKLFNIVLDKYANCPSLDPANTWQVKLTLGETAKGELFELDHLSLGKRAPEIEGEDIDGKKLKLSDYRGKVVVLSFWASWCGPCMAMVPSEVRLAKRMKGKPFALVGVNGDSIQSDARHAVEKKNMSWPSFWDKKGTDGPIPTAWNVSGWPTVFVLDANGVIRLRFEGYDGTNSENLLNEEVNSLVNQLVNKTHS